jgi:hypothetical protein
MPEKAPAFPTTTANPTKSGSEHGDRDNASAHRGALPVTSSGVW